MDVSNELRKKLIEIYKSKGYTISSLANKSGLARSTIDSFLGKNSKTNTITIRSLIHICEALDMKLKDIFNYDVFKEFYSSNYPKSREIKEMKEWLHLSFAVRQRILNIITSENLKIKRISNDSNINYSTVRRFMKGQEETITIETLYEICRAMKIDLYDFFDDPLFLKVKDETERQESKKLIKSSKKLDALV